MTAIKGCCIAMRIVRLHTIAAVCLAALVACRERPAAPPSVRVADTRTPMGTYMTITVYAPDEATGRKAIAAAFAHVEMLETVLSTWRQDSDISRLNHAAGGPPVAVNPHLITVLRRSAKVAEETDGAFDITCGPLAALWKKCLRRRTLPAEAKLTKAKAATGHEAVKVDEKAGTAQLLKPAMRVNVSGIAKGYIVDQAVQTLRKAGIAVALVDAGGDMYALGSPPGRDSWRIGVRDPSRPNSILGKPLLLRDRAVATSGDYEQFTVVDGRRYSHILDPRTGRPIEGMSSVTVVGPDATTADAYATAASVLGPTQAVDFANRRPGVELLVLYRNAGKTLRAESNGFAPLLATDD